MREFSSSDPKEGHHALLGLVAGLPVSAAATASSTTRAVSHSGIRNFPKTQTAMGASNGRDIGEITDQDTAVS